MEFIVVKVPIDSDQVGGIVGKGYSRLTEVAEKAELQYARFDDKTGSIELCGLRTQVEVAKMMISVHRDYLMVYQDMSEERETISKQFEELDEMDGGKGKGKGKAKAKGKDGAKGAKMALGDGGGQGGWQ